LFAITSYLLSPTVSTKFFYIIWSHNTEVWTALQILNMTD